MGLCAVVLLMFRLLRRYSACAVTWLACCGLVQVAEPFPLLVCSNSCNTAASGRKLVSWLLCAGAMTSNGTANGKVDTVKAPPCEDPQRYDGVTRPYTVRAAHLFTCTRCYPSMAVN